jgi:hypothetical protein
MYAVGYPVGHTAAIGLFSKILGKRPQVGREGGRERGRDISGKHDM